VCLVSVNVYHGVCVSVDVCVSLASVIK